MAKENVHNTEQKILKFAELEFLTKGFDGARTTSIAKAAGVTHAMLHYYFRTKELLFERFIEKKMSEIAPLMTCMIGNDDLPLIERIREAVSLHFDFVMNNPELPRFLINEILPHPDRCESFVSNISDILASFDTLQQEVNEASSKGELEHFNVLMLFQSILSMNVFPALMSGLILGVLEQKGLNSQDYMALRKSETIEMIMRRITKKASL